jgi:DNA-binding LacI/PurR family transcriptional regulator
MSVTQKEIAEKLNLSRSMVARALNGYAGVPPETLQRVRDFAQEVGYDEMANSQARGLNARRYGKRAKTGLVALMFAYCNVSSFRELPYWGPLLDGLEAEALELGYELCMCQMRPNELPRLVREQGVDGIISLGGTPSGMSQLGDKQSEMPLITLHSNYGGALNIAPDDYEGARQATRHLLDLGHRRIAYLGVDAALIGAARLRGYVDEMREHRIQVSAEWVETSLTLNFTRVGAYCPGCESCASCAGWDKLMQRNSGVAAERSPFTAIVCHNDQIAMGTAVRAQALGLSVPGDLSIVGFDDLSADYHFKPTITSVNIPRYEMGRRALQVLHEVITDEAKTLEALESREIVFPIKISVRESTQTLDSKRQSATFLKA